MNLSDDPNPWAASTAAVRDVDGLRISSQDGHVLIDVDTTRAAAAGGGGGASRFVEREDDDSCSLRCRRWLAQLWLCLDFVLGLALLSSGIHFNRSLAEVEGGGGGNNNGTATNGTSSYYDYSSSADFSYVDANNGTSDRNGTDHRLTPDPIRDRPTGLVVFAVVVWGCLILGRAVLLQVAASVGGKPRGRCCRCCGGDDDDEAEDDLDSDECWESVRVLCRYAGLHWLTPVMGFYASVTSLLATATRTQTSQYLETSIRWMFLLHSNADSICEWLLRKHYYAVPLALFSAAIGECVRFRLLQMTPLQGHGSGGDRGGGARRYHLRRPWWWASGQRGNDGDQELSESLLAQHDKRTMGLPNWVTSGRSREYNEHAGVTPRRGRRRVGGGGWFGGLIGGRAAGDDGTNDDPLRDAGSVDFASVQEEWASRTEEDPFWWSREDEEANRRREQEEQQQQQQFESEAAGATTPPRQIRHGGSSAGVDGDVSWLGDTPNRQEE